MNLRHSLPAFLFLFGLCACEPKDRAVWSPDGRTAAVLIGHRLFLADEKGGLTGSLESTDDEPGQLLVERMAWSGDSRRLVIHRVRLAPEWEKLRPLLPAAESDRVEALAARMPDLLRAAVALHGDADRADQLLAKLAPAAASETILNALRLAVARDRGAVEASLTDAPKARASLTGETAAESGFFLHELALVKTEGEGGMSVVGTIARGLRGYSALHLSPSYPVVAAGRSRGGEKTHDLEIMALDGTFRETVAAEMSAAFAWTPDGRGLVCLAPVSGGEGPLMRLLRSEVLDEKGRALSRSAVKPQELAIAVMPFAPRLAVLPDGGVLFASQPGTLPLQSGAVVPQPRLYLVPAVGGAIREVPTGEGTLPMDLGYFVPSPDGRRLALVESGTDAVAVIDLASGAGELISAPHPGWKSRTLPSWKSADELAFASLDSESGTVSWRLWKAGGEMPLDLSRDWPAAATSGWLEKSENNPGTTATP